MKPLTLEEVVTAVEGTCDRPMPLGSVTRVTTDSRDVRSGDLFFAIRGERFDGHAFVGRALATGAMAAIVRNDFDWSVTKTDETPPNAVQGDALTIRVDDTVDALARLTRYYRRRVIEGSVTVVAVTGSNGKTTTKAMIAHLLLARWKGLASLKSFNNQIGVPLTLLSVEPSDEFVICEAGTNAPGEIAALGRLIEPEVAVVTGISEVHLEGLGSLARIAEEKLSLLTCLRPGGCAIVNADHELLRDALRRDRDLAELKIVTFGRWPQADLRLTDLRVVTTPAGFETAGTADIPVAPRGVGDVLDAGDAGGFPHLASEFTVNDRFQYRLNVPGRHNVSNALAAIAVARRFGMDHEEIAGRLATFTLPPMRLECRRLGELVLINDAYNASPASMAAAVEVLCDLPAAGRRVLIIGDMRELGVDSERLHRETAEHIAASAVDLVIAIGERSKLVTQTIKKASGGRIAVHAWATTDLARHRVTSFLRANDTVVVKGSRALGLEKLVDAIREWAEVSAQSSVVSGQ